MKNIDCNSFERVVGYIEFYFFLKKHSRINLYKIYKYQVQLFQKAICTTVMFSTIPSKYPDDDKLLSFFTRRKRIDDESKELEVKQTKQRLEYAKIELLDTNEKMDAFRRKLKQTKEELEQTKKELLSIKGRGCSEENLKQTTEKLSETKEELLSTNDKWMCSEENLEQFEEELSQAKELQHIDELPNMQIKSSKGEISLLENLKTAFLNDEDSDVILKVGDQKYPAHKVIVRSRSSVFHAMLKHDMVEKEQGIVDIPDCDPLIFRDFLQYLYTGKVDNVTNDNVFELYHISDKYDVKELRTDCIEFILYNLTVETICDALDLATKHCERALLTQATKFFIDNVKDILTTVKWQNFAKANPIEANELFIKCVTKN